MTSMDDPALPTAPALPASPEQDYAAAAYSMWLYMHEHADPEEHKYNGRPGRWWHGSASSVIRQCWPDLNNYGRSTAWNAIRQRLDSSVNAVVLKPGANPKFWVSETWNGPIPEPHAQAAADAAQPVDQAPPQDPYADIQRMIDDLVASHTAEVRATARAALTRVADGLEGLSAQVREALNSLG